MVGSFTAWHGWFSRGLGVSCLAVGLAWGINVSVVRGYTPESPEVRTMIQRGIAYIKANVDKESQGYYSRLGGMCLTGLAIYKHEHNLNDPLVQAAVAKCKDVCKRGVPWSSESNYDVGIAIIFLCDLDPQLFRPEIDAMLNELYKRQQPGGGWSYADHKTGDTSQTQYGALALWMAHRQGIDVPQERVERLCNWLMRTQAPQGNWGYQGNDPGNFNRVAQSELRMSLAAAGMGSVYVCAELLGFVDQAEERDPNVPVALQEAGAEKRTGPITDKVAPAMLMRCINDGDGYFARIPNLALAATEWQHYYLYGLERYMAFRELARKTKEREPAWYNHGVEYLARNQGTDGGWKASAAGGVIDSCFAVLFLMRGAQQSIRKIVEMSGRLRGGKGLPPDLSKIALDASGNVVDAKATPPLEVLLAEMEKGDLDDLKAQIPERLPIPTDPQQRLSTLARLRRLAMSGPYESRLMAAKTLGHHRDLDNVPILIFALSDPDYRIVKAARDGLRFISRKVDGFGLKVDDGLPVRPDILKAQDQWKQWYLSVAPDGALID